MRRAVTLGAVALAVASLGSGCKRTWQTEAAQPELYLEGSAFTRTSRPLAITMSDMHLPRWVQLANTARFIVVTRDRIKLRVRLIHRWPEMTDLDHWKVWIEDESGHRLYPSDIDKRRTRPVSELVIPGIGGSRGFAYRYSVSLYDGGGDYVFYHRDLYRGDLERLVFVMQRRGMEFRYTWHFVQDAEVRYPAARATSDLVRVSARRDAR